MSNKPVKKATWKHFIAPVAGLFAMLAVICVLNAQYFMAQYMYRFGPHPVVAAQTQVEKQQQPETAKTVAPDPKVIIPSIGVDAPVVYGMTSTIERDIQRALQDGVLSFADTPKPGQPGNGVYVGHSSNAPWVPGNYKFVFTALENVQIGDAFYLNYQGKQYEYRVVNKKIVSPTDVSVLSGTDKPTATLITCTPVGTSKNRLVLLGEQIHPKPATGVAQQPVARTNVLPGN